jgi:hypothetical protein
VDKPRLGSRIGALLAHQRVLTAADIMRVVDAQRTGGGRFGEAVQRLGLASDQQVLRALATQQRVSYLTIVDATGLAHAPGGLSPDTIRALGVVPFAADPHARRLKVATLAPVPRLAVAAIAHLTGWAVEPFLVADGLLPVLAAAYGAGRAGDAGQRVVSGPRDAASRITRAAAEGRIERLAHARCDHHMWVRLEGFAGCEDWLLPIGGEVQEDACRAAHTSL